MDCDVETVAELEVYGLSVKTIDLLDRHDCIFLSDLERLTKEELLSWRQTGPGVLAEIQTALRNYLAGNEVKVLGR